MQLLIGILIGALALLVLSGGGFLLYYLNAVNQNLRKAAEVFGKSAEMAAALTAQVVVSRRMVTSIEQMTATLKVFNSLILRDGTALESHGEPNTWIPNAPENLRTTYGRTPPPPPVAAWDQYANAGEADVLVQSDEEKAEVEARQAAREMGIETDPELSPMPPSEKINFIQS